VKRPRKSHPPASSNHYLRLPDFPSDVVDTLENGDINLYKAEQLAHATAEQMGVSPSRAARL
jgi:hypothetical protein